MSAPEYSPPGQLKEATYSQMPGGTARKLKILPFGDPRKGSVKPHINLLGRWLERAGFEAGSHVSVTSVAPGVLEVKRLPLPLPPVEQQNPLELL